MKIKSFLSEYGLTLVEIVVATVVLSIVVLTAGTVYIASIKEFRRVSDEARVQFEAAFTLEHIYRSLMGAKDIETVSFPASSIVVLSDEANVTPRLQYELTADNTVNFTYNINPPGPGITEKIADYITSLTFNRPLSGEAVGKNNYVTVTITAAKDKMIKTYSTGVVLRGMDPSS